MMILVLLNFAFLIMGITARYN